MLASLTLNSSSTIPFLSIVCPLISVPFVFAGIVTGVTFTSATTPSVAVNSLATPSSSTVYLAPSFISANVSRVTLEASALSGVTLLTAITF